MCFESKKLLYIIAVCVVYCIIGYLWVTFTKTEMKGKTISCGVTDLLIANNSSFYHGRKDT